MKRDPNLKVLSSSQVTQHIKCQKYVQTSRRISIPSGNDQLDWFMDGGIPVGIIALFDQDHESMYYHHFLCSFACEGIKMGHEVVWVSPWDNFSQTNVTARETKLRNLENEPSVPEIDPRLNIAWRYQKLKISEELVPPNKAGHSLNGLKNVLFSGKYRRLSSFNTSFSDILQIIEDNTGKFKNKESSFMNIILEDFGGPTWGKYKKKQWLDFILRLKFAVSSSPTVCYISCPSYYIETHEMSSLISVVDYRINLIPVWPKETEHKEYDGECRIYDYSRINDNVKKFPHIYDDLVFKVKNSRIVIEKISLSSFEVSEADQSNLTCAIPHDQPDDF